MISRFTPFVLRLVTRLFKTLVLWSCMACLLVSPSPAMAKKDPLNGLPEGLYAQMETNRGTILIQLYYKRTPLTVINFAGLAKGTMDTDTRKGEPFYDGLTFHRVIADFMIQGGDPLGSGRGGPGYAFADEFHPELRHNGAGILSMANSGPNTNGSQFFITHKATPWLDFKHTVFGTVVIGMDVVNTISKGDGIKKVTILAKGDEARAFKTDQAAFDRMLKQMATAGNDEIEADLAEFKKAMKKKFPDAISLESGLMYVPLKPGGGKAAKKEDLVAIHFTGLLPDSKPFASSKDKGVPVRFVLGKGDVLKAWDLGVEGMKKGEIRRLLVPYPLGYGKKGYPGLIPPKAPVFFDMELVDIQ